MRTDSGRRVVLCFDRDHTVSVNPHPERSAVPIGWVQYWAHETDIPVWATGNQHLRAECSIPGITEAEEAWEQITGEEYEYENSTFENFIKPRRRDGLRLIQDLYQTAFPDDRFLFIVVDDVDVSDLAGEGPWHHYLPWYFVEYIETDYIVLDKPPEGSYTNDGVPMNSTRNPDFDADPEKPLQQIHDQEQPSA